MVADELCARAFAKLVGRQARDGTEQLEEHRRAAVFASRLAIHRNQAPRPVALPAGGITVPIDGAIAHGVGGVGGVGETVAIDVFVEGRPFTRLRPSPAAPGIAPLPELPLIAAVEIAPELCGTTFEALPYNVIAELAREIEGAATALVLAIAAQRPDQLAIPSSARTLLARWLPRSERAMSEVMRALRSAPILTTLDGARVSIEQARQPGGTVSIATWHELWLGPVASTTVDDPIVFVPEGESETRAIIARLHGGPVRDVTDDVRKLQAQRAMARGRLPTPKARDVPHDLVRDLSALGAIGQRLGHGEIGLVAPTDWTADASELLIHDHGILRDRVPLDVMPSIQLAIEAPELVKSGLAGAMADDAQALAIELVRSVTRERPLLPPAVRRSVMRAWLARRVPDLDGIPLFETIDDRVLDHTAVAEQISRYGDVWAIPPPANTPPLDERRVVLRMTAEEIALACSRRRLFVDATQELMFDSLARRNRARPLATGLTIPHDGVLAIAELTAMASTGRARRGWRAPGQAWRRAAASSHTARCARSISSRIQRWPTIAMIDDARLEPDRTWAKPEARGAWLEVVDQLHEASERALTCLFEPLLDALAIVLIDARALDGSCTCATRLQRAATRRAVADRCAVSRAVDDRGHRSAFACAHRRPRGPAAVASIRADRPGRRAHRDHRRRPDARLLAALLARRTDIDPDVVAVHVTGGSRRGACCRSKRAGSRSTASRRVHSRRTSWSHCSPATRRCRPSSSPLMPNPGPSRLSTTTRRSLA